MYTQCPDCNIAFRVTALVLQKAGGRVRCGGCGNAFSAIDYLSEQLPVPVGDQAADDETAGTDTAGAASGDNSGLRANDEYVSKSEALLKTLSELAGDDNVRIEDTGVEWRVLEDVDEEEILIEDTGAVESLDDTRIGTNHTEDGGEQQILDLNRAPRDERRYDDNTPLPDDFDDEEDQPYVPPVPQRRAGDKDTDTDFDTHQIDMAMGEEADGWADLLDDEDGVGSQAPLPASANGTEIPFEVEEELAAIHSELLENAAALRAQPADYDSGAVREPTPSEPTKVNEMSPEPEDMAIAAERAEASTLDDAAATESLELADDKHATEEAVETEQAEESIVIETPDYSAAAEDPEDSAYLEELEDPDFVDELKEEPEEQKEQKDPPKEAEDTQDSDSNVATKESSDVEEREKSAVSEEPEKGDPQEDQFDDYEEDELTADQEADIVGKLRESTGAFQKQIEAAQQALNQGDIDFYGDKGEHAAEDTQDQDEVKPDDPADNDERAGATAQEVTLDTEAENDDEIDENSMPEVELQVDENDDGADDELEAESADDAADEPATTQGDEELSHEDRLAHTMRMAGIDPADLEGDNVETIIMEGGNVRDALERERHADDQEAIAKLEDSGFLADTYMMNKGKMAGGRRRSDPAGIGVILGVAILALLLAAQWVHNSRESLATYGFFNQTIAPVYRAVGQAVTPEWDIKGWRFLNTRGSADEDSQLLTIFSTITNASTQPLPYPLVHVSLTDRYEEIIGSKVLEPGEYLAGDLDPSRPVVPGDQFGAVIAIASPSAEAVGFKLNVCYRVTAGRVRCATEDFKD